MPITDAGEMNERIVFLKKIARKDPHGTPQSTNEEVFSCWSMIMTQYLKEVTATIGTKLENTVTFVVRHQQRQEVTNDMVIKHQGIQYEIIQINPDLQHKAFMTVIAREVT
ncbi:phage head closure protein [Bacillus sp. FSL W7-1360]